jgi:hypothetical protein
MQKKMKIQKIKIYTFETFDQTCSAQHPRPAALATPRTAQVVRVEGEG